MNRSHRRRRGRTGETAGVTIDRLLERATGLHGAGRLKQAVSLYRRVVAAAPEHPHARHFLGLALHQLGRTEEGLPHLEAAATAMPGDAMFHYNLAEAYRVLGRLSDAEAAYDRAARLAPGNPDVLLGLGSVTLMQGRPVEAARYLHMAAAGAPDDGEIAECLGDALAEAGDDAQAVAAYERARSLGPASASLSVRLGQAYHRLDRIDRALPLLREAVAADGGDVAARMALGRVLMVAGGGEAEAAEQFEAALAVDPDLAEAHAALGDLELARGRFDAAAEHLVAALERDHGLAEAAYSLAKIERGPAAAVDIGLFERAAAAPVMSDQQRARALFALARRYEAAGRYDDAFETYARANALRAAEARFDPERFTDDIERQCALFDAHYFAARRGYGAESDLPVFVVGMPRSGTTMVERLLASHPAVRGGGLRYSVERQILSLPRRLGRDVAFPGSVAAMDAELARALGQAYVEEFGELGPDILRVTDHLPENFLRLGYVATVLPRARVVFCRRDPIDTCLSCYFQDFRGPETFSFDLDHLVAYYRGYERIVAHWRSVLPLSTTEIWYEDLVSDFQTAARDLIAFCGLEWDDACARFHESDEVVHSPSLWQVRQPVYTSSLGRWKRFERHIGPLLEAFGQRTESR